jgi:hypothetical protein
MKILVTGGTGLAGSHSIRDLLEAGHDVRALVRSEAKLARVFPDAPRGLTSAVGDIADRASVERALSGCDALLHAAAVVSMDNASPEALIEANLGGVKKVLGAALDAGCEAHRARLHAERLVPRGGQRAGRAHHAGHRATRVGARLRPQQGHGGALGARASGRGRAHLDHVPERGAGAGRPGHDRVHQRAAHLRGAVRAAHQRRLPDGGRARPGQGPPPPAGRDAHAAAPPRAGPLPALGHAAQRAEGRGRAQLRVSRSRVACCASAAACSTACARRCPCPSRSRASRRSMPRAGAPFPPLRSSTRWASATVRRATRCARPPPGCAPTTTFDSEDA